MFQSFNIDSPSAAGTTVVTLYNPSPCPIEHGKFLAEEYAAERGEVVTVSVFDGLALLAEITCDPNECRWCGEVDHDADDADTLCRYAAEDLRKADALADLLGL